MVHSVFPRTISSQISRPFIRSFAEIVAENPTRRRKFKRREAGASAPSGSPEPSKPKEKLIQKLPVREDHGLYAFFRRKSDDTLRGEERFEVVESPDSYQISSGMIISAVKICLLTMITGRPWFASELRHKSFKDLHTLWYVCLREKNLLATQKEEARRMGVTNPDLQVSGEKVRDVRACTLDPICHDKASLFSVGKPWLESRLS